MKMFLGEYQPTITEGSRVALPKKLRDQILGDDIVMSKGFEKCIFVYDKSDWVEESYKQVENPITDIKTRNLKRYLFSSAAELTLDSQSRFVIPQNLKEYAGLNKDITILGAGDHIEVWDTTEWLNYLQKISTEVVA